MTNAVAITNKPLAIRLLSSLASQTSKSFFGGAGYTEVLIVVWNGMFHMNYASEYRSLIGFASLFSQRRLGVLPE